MGLIVCSGRTNPVVTSMVQRLMAGVALSFVIFDNLFIYFSVSDFPIYVTDFATWRRRKVKETTVI